MKFNDVPHVEIRRTQTVQCADEDVRVSGPSTVLPMLREILQGKEQESFVILIIDGTGRVSAWREVARGTAHSVEVPVRDLFRTALMCGAHGIILSHNHPSGNPEPSSPDIVLTMRLKEAGALIGCPVIDHIIITDSDSYYSFANGGEASNGTLNINAPRQGPEL